MVATFKSFLPKTDSSLSGSKFKIDVPKISEIFWLYVDSSSSTESVKPSSSVSIPPSLLKSSDISTTAFWITGKSDGDLYFGIIYLPLLAIVGWVISYYLYKIGYKIKS